MQIIYKNIKIELVWAAPKQIDVYINGFPRLCRATVAQCMKQARTIIDRGY
jgi:hypothetical protein